jgi:DNA-binding FrmR family transcriptional regulator
LVAWALPAVAGEGLITKVRGRTLAIDKGADDGLEVGLEVTVVRPPGEAIIHPLTGENLGAEIEIAGGRINKVSARAASIQLDGSPIISVRPGDIARFQTIEEKMVMEQEVAMETAEQASRERGEIRSKSSRLARNISSIQGSIRGLEKAIRDLRRFDDDVVKPQFNAINRQIKEMRDELTKLHETVSLLNAVPIQEMGGEEGQDELSEQDIERLRLIIQEEIDNLQAQLAVVPLPPTDTLPPSDLMEDGLQTSSRRSRSTPNSGFWGSSAALACVVSPSSSTPGWLAAVTRMTKRMMKTTS